MGGDGLSSTERMAEILAPVHREDLGLEHGAAGKVHRDRAGPGAVDDVGVGHDEALASDHEARADAPPADRHGHGRAAEALRDGDAPRLGQLLCARRDGGTDEEQDEEALRDAGHRDN